ncbi:nuclear transport factor 2 family protein [Nesterenkonia xinjiangensis]|uniref:DUF4440 domain-containing protein n=1 Tax=Nesterenkonia xinjiangensis TaxID=225327 RepID=A0A7Z0KAI4_9MICC|nr:nuclear transport factor 2 family protein [Nesterenkonia xinjiangensis]NYJ78903.1 hypothetical protein [Nesterenkonia xinjiangensis]
MLDLSTLLTLEHEGWNALCENRGGAFYGDLMAPDARMILVNGMVLDRDGVVGSLDGAPAWDTYEITDPALIPLGADCAALIYRARATRTGEDPFVALMSSTYRLIEARVRLVLYQQTAITH